MKNYKKKDMLARELQKKLMYRPALCGGFAAKPGSPLLEAKASQIPGG